MSGKKEQLKNIIDASVARKFLMQNPDFLINNPDLYSILTPPDRSEGDRIVDFQNIMIEKTIPKIPIATKAFKILYGKNGTLSKGTQSSSRYFSISTPSGFPAPTSCKATKCIKTRAIRIRGSATTCKAKKREIVAPEI